MIAFKENENSDETCHECGKPAPIKIVGKHHGCHYCGNEIYFCLYHLRTMAEAALKIEPKRTG